MIKKIGVSIVLLVLGLIISVLAEPKLRLLIQTLFKSLTNNAIHFYGKDFHLFASPYYYLSFGLLLLVAWFSWNGLTPRQKIIIGLVTTLIFLISIILISWLSSNAMIVECTACNDGTRGIHYNDINYDGIIVGSLFLSMIPSGLRLMRREKQPAHNKMHVP
jgi:hypothetical protein